MPLNERGSSAAAAAQQLFHNQQIIWNPARLFKPEESMTFQYIKEGGVDLHFLDHTHLEGFDAQVPYCIALRLYVFSHIKCTWLRASGVISNVCAGVNGGEKGGWRG